MRTLLETFLYWGRRIIPRRTFFALRPWYHLLLAWLAAVLYRYPSRRLTVIGVTGTNGKTTTVELIAAILKAAGYKTASLSSIRFRIGEEEWNNDLKMTMPGRFHIQRFLRKALRRGCTHAVLEVTSEGILQHRHRFITFDVAALTNVTPEHIEAHGSFEAYKYAKSQLFRIASIHVLNADDNECSYFSVLPAQKRLFYSIKNVPAGLVLKLPGEFNRSNAMAALTVARSLGVDDAVSMRALNSVAGLPGRLEVLQEEPFGVVVDYAHTPDALRNVYETLSAPRLICVLGSAGGGRDKWKRPEMGRIAGEYCAAVIITSEDPYDENPHTIMKEVEQGLYQSTRVASRLDYKKIADRREAIHAAFSIAKKDDVVIITGKGSEPWMMAAGGVRIPWDDRRIAAEELKKLNHNE